MIPKPTNRLTNGKNARKGDYLKYVNDNKERERTIPTRLSSRRGSSNKNSARPVKKEPVSKTELLYQKARSALGKSRKPKGKLLIYFV